MANSVDLDQIAPSGAVWSGSTLLAYAILSDTLVNKILGHTVAKVFAQVQVKELEETFFYIIYTVQSNFNSLNTDDSFPWLIWTCFWDPQKFSW